MLGPRREQLSVARDRASRASAPAGPTVPSLLATSLLIAPAAHSSVIPHASSSVIPQASKNSSTSLRDRRRRGHRQLHAPAEQIAHLARARAGLQADVAASRTRSGAVRPARSSSRVRYPTPSAQWNSVRLSARLIRDPAVGGREDLLPHARHRRQVRRPGLPDVVEQARRVTLPVAQRAVAGRA